MFKFRAKIWDGVKDIDFFKNILKKNKDRLNDYMNVFIFDNYTKMYDYVDKFEECKQERNYAGRTYCFYQKLLASDDELGYKDKVVGYSKNHGNIYLCDENNELSFSTISHEVSHAIIGYFNRHLLEYNPIVKKKFDNVPNEVEINEELFCYMVGNINNQILTQYYKYCSNIMYK